MQRRGEPPNLGEWHEHLHMKTILQPINHIILSARTTGLDISSTLGTPGIARSYEEDMGDADPDANIAPRARSSPLIHLGMNRKQ